MSQQLVELEREKQATALAEKAKLEVEERVMAAKKPRLDGPKNFEHGAGYSSQFWNNSQDSNNKDPTSLLGIMPADVQVQHANAAAAFLASKDWTKVTAEASMQTTFLEVLPVLLDNLTTLSGQRNIYFSEARGLRFTDTHASPDGAVGDLKPDVSVSCQPTVLSTCAAPDNVFCLIEFQLGQFDKSHAGDNIRRSERVLQNCPTRTFVFILWINKVELVLHKAFRQSVGSYDEFGHEFSVAQPLFANTTEAATGLGLLHYILCTATHAQLGVGQTITFPASLEKYLVDNNLRAEILLGKGASASVYRTVSEDSKTERAVKVYDIIRAGAVEDLQREVTLLKILEEKKVDGVPRVIYSDDSTDSLFIVLEQVM